MPGSRRTSSSRPENLDGDVWILESWKGDLRAGDRITIAALSTIAAPERRTILVWRGDSSDDTNRPRQVTGRRMILFLRVTSPQGTFTPDKRTFEAPLSYTSLEGMPPFVQCIGWVEKGEVYTYSDYDGIRALRPGYRHRGTEDAIKVNALHTIEVREKFDGAKKAFDRASTKVEKARAIEPLLLTDIYECRTAAYDLIVTCGDEAIPSLRRILEEESHAAFHSNALSALESTGSRLAPPVVVSYIEQEHAHWKKIGPSLKSRWYDVDGAEQLRYRYWGLTAALRLVENLKPPEVRETVKSLRDYYFSLPPPSYGEGRGSLGDALEAAVKALAE